MNKANKGTFIAPKEVTDALITIGLYLQKTDMNVQTIGEFMIMKTDYFKEYMKDYKKRKP